MSHIVGCDHALVILVSIVILSEVRRSRTESKDPFPRDHVGAPSWTAPAGQGGTPESDPAPSCLETRNFYIRNSTLALSAYLGISLTAATRISLAASVVSANPIASSSRFSPSSTTAVNSLPAFSARRNPSRSAG